MKSCRCQENIQLISIFTVLNTKYKLRMWKNSKCISLPLFTLHSVIKVAARDDTRQRGAEFFLSIGDRQNIREILSTFFSKFCANHTKRKFWNFWSENFQPFFEGWKFSTSLTGRYYRVVYLFKKLARSDKASPRYALKTMLRKKRNGFSYTKQTTSVMQTTVI